jgi:hypothetical protein
MQNGRINTSYQIYNANVKMEIIFKKVITWHNLYYVDEHCNEVLVCYMTNFAGVIAMLCAHPYGFDTWFLLRLPKFQVLD